MSFAVIYRSYIKSGCEAKYQKNWHIIARYFVENCGAIGSCLHQAEDGMWLAYSRWPDKATRDVAWPGDNDPSEKLPAEVRSAILTIKECKDKSRDLPEICLNVVDDLLLN